jgi:small conductance mechanosensitive channel
VLAALSCDADSPFDGVCQAISGHDPTGIAGPVVERLTGAITILVAVYIVGRVVRRVTDAALQRANADRQVRTLLRNVISGVTYFTALLGALVVAGMNIGVLLTAAGVSTVAIGLAFLDMLRNILAGIWLLLERPFRLGDNIVVVDHAGVVQNITLRTTTLRTGDGSLAILPNLTAFTNAVVNLSTYDLRQFTVSVRLRPDANLESAVRAARSALEANEAVAPAPSPSVQPQIDPPEGPLLHCKYWLDQNAHDPDAVAADVAQHMWKAVSAG